MTSQVKAQAEILPISALMQPAAVTGSSTIIKRLIIYNIINMYTAEKEGDLILLTLGELKHECNSNQKQRLGEQHVVSCQRDNLQTKHGRFL